MAVEACSTAILSTIIKKLFESIFDYIRSEISCVLKYKSYIKDLKEKVEELNNEKERVKVKVNDAEKQGDEIFNGVQQWLKEVDEFIEVVVTHVNKEEEKAKKHCFKGLCPNFIQHYKLSKETLRAIKGGIKLLEKQKGFPNVSHRRNLRSTEFTHVGDDYEAFDSRVSNFRDIMEALKDENVNMIGVYGMGGVGKTTLVKKVALKANEDKLFDEVVMAEVAQDANIKKIQEEIADQLGLVFTEQSLSGRASRLRDRLKQGKKILVILDNIWKKLDLDAIGIPLQDDNKKIVQLKKEKKVQCTILLTSRNQDVLRNDMNTQKNISMEQLSDIEARNFFGKIVGDLVKENDFQPIATEIVIRCAGLPIAIKTIANALKNKRIFVWRDALNQLRRSNPRHIANMDDTLYSTIELSYKFLENPEAKSLLLLFSFRV